MSVIVQKFRDCPPHTAYLASSVALFLTVVILAVIFRFYTERPSSSHVIYQVDRWTGTVWQLSNGTRTEMLTKEQDYEKRKHLGQLRADELPDLPAN